jgi:hypothetical protein
LGLSIQRMIARVQDWVAVKCRVSLSIVAALLLTGCLQTGEPDAVAVPGLSADFTSSVTGVSDSRYVLLQPNLTVNYEYESIPDWMSVTVRNVDNDTWFQVARDDFRLRDSEGFVFQHYDRGYYSAPEAFPITQRLEAGEAVRGTLVFEVSDGKAPYTLVFDWPEGRIALQLD